MARHINGQVVIAQEAWNTLLDHGLTGACQASGGYLVETNVETPCRQYLKGPETTSVRLRECYDLQKGMK